MTKKKGILEVVEKVLKNDTPNDSNTENDSVTTDNGKVSKIWKVCLLILLAVGVALGCCDTDCLLFNLRSLFGL